MNTENIASDGSVDGEQEVVPHTLSDLSEEDVVTRVEFAPGMDGPVATVYRCDPEKHRGFKFCVTWSGGFWGDDDERKYFHTLKVAIGRIGVECQDMFDESEV